MNILITNDDGHNAIGIQQLIESLRATEHRIIVIAPQKNCTAVGASISWEKDVLIEKHKTDYYVVHGTPVDCIEIAHSMPGMPPFDLAISGINDYENIGSDLNYSGTFNAALHAHLRGIKVSVAMSLFRPTTETLKKSYFLAAQKIAAAIVEHHKHTQVEEPLLINVNIPYSTADNLQDICLCHLGSRIRGTRQNSYTSQGEGKWLYRLKIFDKLLNKKGTDAEAILNNQASISFLKPLPFWREINDSPYAKEWLNAIKTIYYNQ